MSRSRLPGMARGGGERGTASVLTRWRWHVACAAWLLCSGGAMASASPGIRLNQVYANGGWGAGSEPPLYARDFVELFNPTLQPIGMSGWSLQVCAAGGGVWTRLDLPSAVLQPGGSFLISLPGGSAASLAALPPADAAFNVGGIPSGGFK
ncbi:MAG: lamin tail domain-containing protein, partial [bacterium]